MYLLISDNRPCQSTARVQLGSVSFSLPQAVLSVLWQGRGRAVGFISSWSRGSAAGRDGNSRAWPIRPLYPDPEPEELKSDDPDGGVRQSPHESVQFTASL
jgi:hypothetical protein